MVLSRYDGIAGHDWMAMPLIPYLYAVDKVENIPLFVNPKLVALLRERYLRTLPLLREDRRLGASLRACRVGI